MNAAIQIAGLIAVSLTSTALGQTVIFGDAPGENGGGEFRARITGVTPIFTAPLAGSVGGSGGSQFMTFCLELSEFVGFGPTYSYSIGTAAVGGGLGGGSPDPISQQTANLYRLFATGTLAGYDYSTGSGSTRGNSANALQALFWTLENEVTYNPANGEFRRTDNSGLVGTLTAAEQALYTSWLSLPFSSTADYGVRAINPMDGTTRAQSMLILIPLPPAAWAGVGTLAGLALFGAIRRRNNDRAGV
jgi:hypothetical protein